MPRIRSIKPEFFSSEQVVSVSIPARYLFEGIWVFGDDDGYIAASPIQLKMKVFPGDAVEVAPLIKELLEAGLVENVDTDQGAALWVPSFRNHQSPKYPTPSKFTRQGASLSERSPRTAPVVPKSSRSTHPGEREIEEREERRGEEKSKSEVAVAPIRPEILNLLDLLDSLIVANGSKKPARTKKNIDAARLLLDADGRSVEDVAGAIRWSQADEFWRANILSMAALRAKYDQLRLAAERKRADKGQTMSKADRNAAEFQRLYGAGVDVREVEA